VPRLSYTPPTSAVLVAAPAFVGWLHSGRFGWEAAYSHDNRQEVKRLMYERYGEMATTCVLPMGQRPVEIER
jgi:hypothetical protein